ncbi:MAG: TetR/AcrR family transcriptional regulator [Spirochaeta sp.]|jgi:TetR/AcrR family transcriptional repressor of mexJK operon|nr:TetR/AcrR family transcriptional regulator [Spirochaeta sp.]
MHTKRNRILETAEREFLQHGFDGTSIDTIVDHIGGSKSTVYAHFRDKAILFAEALTGIRREIDFSLADFRQRVSSRTQDSLVCLVIELISVQYHERALHLLRLVISESDRFPEVARQYYDEGLATLVSQTSGFLAECRDAGAHFAGTTDAASELMLSLTHGPAEMRILLGLDPPPDPAGTVRRAEMIVARFVDLVRWQDAPEGV